MTIQTDFYGEVEYEKADLVTIDDGLFGFPGLSHYLPLCISEEDDDTMVLFQSTERPEVAFVVINPIYLCPDYSPVLTKEELSCLNVSESGELSYYVMCVMQENYLENTVNLKCPIAINPQTRKGMQIILGGSQYGYRHKLNSFPSIMDSANLNDRSNFYADSQTQEE